MKPTTLLAAQDALNRRVFLKASDHDLPLGLVSSKCSVRCNRFHAFKEVKVCWI